MSVFPLDESIREEFAAAWERSVAGIGAAHPTVELIPGTPVCGLMRDLVPEYPSILTVAGSTGPRSEFSWGILLDATAAAAIPSEVVAALAGGAGSSELGTENALLAVATFASDLANAMLAAIGGAAAWQTTPGWQGLLERGYFVDVPEGQMPPAPGLERLLSPGAKVVMADVAVLADSKSAPSLHFLLEPAMVELTCVKPAVAAQQTGAEALGSAQDGGDHAATAEEPTGPDQAIFETAPLGRPGDGSLRVIHGDKASEPGRDQVIPASAAPRVTARRATFEPVTDRSVRRSPEDLQAGIGLLMDVPLQISAELGRTRRKVREVMALAPGSVVELDRLAGEPVDVLVNGKLLGKGEVVVINENFAIRITDIVSVAERVQELA